MTRRYPPKPRAALLAGAACIVMLCGAVAWSALGSGGTTQAGLVFAEPAAAEATDPAAAVAEPAAAMGSSNWWDPPRTDLGAALLASKFQPERGGPRLLRDLLETRVTIINVWANYCAPCKREFAAFVERGKEWGEDVQFVAVELPASDSTMTAPRFPRAWISVLDALPGGTVQELLGKELPAGSPIPITLALDCQERLRWYHTGEISDWGSFDGMLAILRAELQASPNDCVRRGSVAVVPTAVKQQPKPLLRASVPAVQKTVRYCEIGEDCRRDCVCESGHSCPSESPLCPGDPHR